jgi:hypothetical protein
MLQELRINCKEQNRCEIFKKRRGVGKENVTGDETKTRSSKNIFLYTTYHYIYTTHLE